MAKNIHLLQNKYYERPTRWWFVLMFSFWDVSLLILWHCRLGRHQIKLVSKKENEFEVKIHLGNKKPWTSEPVTFAPGWAGMVTHGGGGHRRHLYLREKKTDTQGLSIIVRQRRGDMYQKKLIPKRRDSRRLGLLCVPHHRIVERVGGGVQANLHKIVSLIIKNE